MANCQDKLTGKPKALKSAGALEIDNGHGAADWVEERPIKSLDRSIGGFLRDCGALGTDDWDLDAAEMASWIDEDDEDEDVSTQRFEMGMAKFRASQALEKEERERKRIEKKTSTLAPAPAPAPAPMPALAAGTAEPPTFSVGAAAASTSSGSSAVAARIVDAVPPTSSFLPSVVISGPTKFPIEFGEDPWQGPDDPWSKAVDAPPD